MWLDGDRQRREIAVSQVPGRTDRGLKERRGGTSKGVAVCLCFLAIQEISRGRYQGAPFGVPSPFLRGGGRLPEPPTHAEQFAGSDDACLDEGATMQNFTAQPWDAKTLSDALQEGLERQKTARFKHDWNL